MISGRLFRGTRHHLQRVATYSTTAALQDRLVIAVGGNALQRRGERLTIENMLKAAADMAPTVKALADEHEVVLTHGNGPQVGELALERSAATFDVLGAESTGQIGYVLAQAMASVGLTAVPIVTQVVVDAQSEAFRNPYVMLVLSCRHCGLMEESHFPILAFFSMSSTME